MLRLRLGWPSWNSVKKGCVFLLVTAGVIWLYLWRLGTLTPGFSSAEIAARATTAKFNDVYNSPINAPQRLLQYGLQAAGHHGAFWLRLPSVGFAIIFLGLFYLLVKNWFGRVVGTLTTVILATTPWVILLARNATDSVLLMAPIAILSAYTWFARAKAKRKETAWLVLVAIAAVSLYVPGMIWLELAAALVAKKELISIIKSLRRPVLIASGLLKLIILLPLILAIIRHSSVLKILILWPTHWPGIVITIKAIAWAGLALVWRTPYHTDIIIGRLPILDATQIVLVLFGVYALWAKARHQLYVLSGVIGLGILASGINQDLLLVTLGLPAIMIIAAAGLRYLYIEWRTVFPSNPIPRWLAVTLMVVLVALHVVLGIRYALVAWPHTVAVHQAYVLK